DAGKHIRVGIDMIGAKDVNAFIVATIEFVGVVGNIGKSIGGLAAAFNEHRILFFAKFRCAEPGGPVFIISQLFVSKHVYDMINGSVIIDFLLIKKGIHLDIHAAQR